jgi:alpha-glutamyl/putrescinyl thymine pyrophosphorylase clade 1
MAMNLEVVKFWMMERESIRKRREAGEPPPWTDDAILANNRFCNVRREDDRVTIWIKENIRERYADAVPEKLLSMLVIGRLINLPNSLAELIAERAWPMDGSFDVSSIACVLRARAQRGEKVISSAYIVGSTESKGSDKPAYIAKVVKRVWDRRNFFQRLFAEPQLTMQRVHYELKQTKGLGEFLAYQIVVDLRFTKLLRDAPDVQRWAAAGPGTRRGLNRIHYRTVDFPLSQDRALREMRELFAVLQKECGDIAIDFSDVPNILCETDKYLRAKHDQKKLKNKFVPSAGV